MCAVIDSRGTKRRYLLPAPTASPSIASIAEMGRDVGLPSCPIGDDLYITERETNFFSPRNVDC